MVKKFRYVNQEGGNITFDAENGYILKKPSGVDTLTVNLSEAQGIDQIGSTVQSVNVMPRPITINGTLTGRDQNAQKERLLAVVRPDLVGRLYADNYYLDVYPTATPTIEARRFYGSFQFSVKAPYPYWQSGNRVSQALSGIQKLFKLPWNMMRPWRFGHPITSQFVNVRNDGHVPIPFTLTISARDEASNPSVMNVTTGQTLKINKNILQSERVVITITHDRVYATSSEEGDIRGAIDLNSNFMRLSVGDNVLKPAADSGLFNLEITLDFAFEIVGVAL